MKCSEQAVPLWAVSCFSGSFDAASEDVLMRHQKVLRRGLKRCALRPPDRAIRGEFRDGGYLEATQVYKYLSRVDKLRANPAGFRVSAAQPKSDAGGDLKWSYGMSGERLSKALREWQALRHPGDQYQMVNASPA